LFGILYGIGVVLLVKVISIGYRRNFTFSI
jgi:hypothetical protein